ncbi:MAG: hypothetical protein FJ224_01905 [Lentisphaerae bacterium]|nr:hypothetical protein [Lentisphaerota bacterium]
MRIALLIGLAMLFMAGCATTPAETYRNCMRSWYGRTHKDRPEEIKEAVKSGRLVAGMNTMEAGLCWGTPTRKEPIKSEAVASEVWIYEETIGTGASSLFDITVVRSKLVMTNGPAGPAVSNWTVYE